MKYLYLTFFCFIASISSAQHCGIHPPTNLQISDITSCTATLRWDPVPEAADYQVRYKLSTESIWTPKTSTNHDTFYVFTGLLSNRKYDLSVRSICTDNTKSSFQKIKAKTTKCTLPSSVNVVSAGDYNVRLKWSGICMNDSAYYKYKTWNGSWTSGLVTNANSILLTGLQPGSLYLYQISTCTDTLGNWTEVDTFTVSSRPNIILIILDDARYDLYSCNGAPSFFQTPFIDRIANEGVNFKNYFNVCSICVPSRACMASGLYPIKNGATDNEDHLDEDVVTVHHLLHENGYYTAIVGKNQGVFKYESGDFDFWMSSKSDDTDPVKVFDYNGGLIAAEGTLTEILTDTARALIERVNDPLFLWLAYRVPHEPIVPAPEYIGLFDDDPMPVGSDTAKYTVNYPSFLDGFKPKRLIGGEDLIDQYQQVFEVIAELDSAVGRLLDALESTAKLDNTLLIFVSDNGHLIGEHGFYVKRLAYEPSLKIPMFIRYPQWFPASSIITSQMALNIDIAPTLLEAAGIPNTYSMDGTSLRQLYSGAASRDEMYYQYLYATENDFGDMPGIRAIRDLNYKYIHYGCINDTTEEFFDLVNDPDEMINLVNTEAYESLIQQYRDKLQEMRTALGDTLEETMLNCYIKNPYHTRLSENSAVSNNLIKVFPNPSSGKCTVNFSVNDQFFLQIFNAFGQVVYSEEGMGNSVTLDLSSLPSGLYFIRYRNPQQEAIVKWMVNK